MKKTKFLASLILAGAMALLPAAAPALALAQPASLSQASSIAPLASSPLFDRDIREIERTTLWMAVQQDGDAWRTFYHYDSDKNVDGVAVLYKDLSEAPPAYILEQAGGNGGSAEIGAEIALGIVDQCRVELIV
ncbi:MAG: hypothetical protein LBL83_10855, partial [Clostridiales bacterium]|nr:hypothetical protein [Clostridiales bacterium]